MTEERQWIVVNQSPSPAFERMLARLAGVLGPCLLLSGRPQASAADPALVVARGPEYERGSKLSRARSWLAFTWWCLRRLQAIEGTPFLLVVSNPPFTLNLASLLHERRGWPFAALIYDIYPEHMLRMGWLRRGGVAAGAWTALNRRALQQAEAVLTLGEAMRRTLEERFELAGQVTVTPMWTETDVFRPVDRAENDFAATHGLRRGFTVMYSGNMGATHGLEVIPAAARLTASRAEVRYLLIGDGFARPSLEVAVAHHALDNVTMLPRQPWTTVPSALAAADVIIVAQARDAAGLSVPSKTYAALAVGAPLIALAPAGSDLAALVEGHQVGVRVEPGDAAGLARAVVALADDPSARLEMGRRARLLAEREHSAEIVFAQLRRALSRAAGTTAQVG